MADHDPSDALGAEPMELSAARVAINDARNELLSSDNVGMVTAICLIQSLEYFLTASRVSAGGDTPDPNAEAIAGELSENKWQLDQAILDAEELPRPAEQIARLKWLRDNIDRLVSGDSSRLSTDAARLKEAFSEYGDHRSSCAVAYATGATCDCGFDAMLAEVEGRSTPVREDDGR